MMDTKTYRTKRNILTLAFGLLTLVQAITVNSQNIDTLALDSGIISGKLPNGMSYYIKNLPNSEEKVQIQLYIKSGNNREIEGEWQLAHLLEHIPISQFRNELLSKKGKLMKKTGLSLKDTSGATGKDYTQYGISYSSRNENALNVSLNYLKKIAGGNLKLSSQVITGEKGVIYDEYIYRDGPQNYQKAELDALFSDCYTMPVTPLNFWKHVESFSAKQFQKFMKKWYRPELSILVFTGNITNIEKLQNKIHTVFSEIAPSDSIELDNKCQDNYLQLSSKFKVLKPSPDSNISDDTTIQLFIKDHYKNTGLDRMQWEWIKPIMVQYITEGQIQLQKESSLNYNCKAYWDPKLQVMKIHIRTEQDNEKTAIQNAWGFIKKIKRDGVSSDDWHKLQVLGEQSLKQIDTTKASYWERQIKHYVLREEPLPSNKIGILKQWWSGLSLSEFNSILKNFIPEQPADIGVISSKFLHDEHSIRDWILESKPVSADPPLEGISNNFIANSFFKDLETKGHTNIRLDSLGTNLLQLDNGLQLILKKQNGESSTDSKRIMFHGFRSGGAAGIPKAYRNVSLLAPEVVRHLGVEPWDNQTLQHISAQNSIRDLYPYVNNTESGIKGSVEKEDLEIFLQIIYAYICLTKKDVIAFDHWKWLQKLRFDHPPFGKASSDFISAISNQLNIQRNKLSISEQYHTSQKTNIDEVLFIYDQLFKRADAFTFIISGDFDEKKLLPLLEKYLGNLPNSGQPSIKKNKLTSIPTGPIHQVLEIPAIMPEHQLISVRYLFPIEADNWEAPLQMNILAELIKPQLQQLRYTQKRGIYLAMVSSLIDEENQLGSIGISFSCRETETKPILKDIQKIINLIHRSKVDKQNLDKIIRTQILPKYDRLSKNNKERLGKEFQKKKLLNGLSPRKISKMAKKYLIDRNRYEFIGKHTKSSL
ncbi:MAG TPA: insulinase family protein [Dysgonamonadaceae bacterium]|nr:insulinase family protein [Dysgonamonadaceae bacterium]